MRRPPPGFAPSGVRPDPYAPEPPSALDAGRKARGRRPRALFVLPTGRLGRGAPVGPSRREKGDPTLHHPAYLTGLARERVRILVLESVRTRRPPRPAKPAQRFEVRALQFLDAGRADRR